MTAQLPQTPTESSSRICPIEMKCTRTQPDSSSAVPQEYVIELTRFIPSLVLVTKQASAKAYIAVSSSNGTLLCMK